MSASKQPENVGAQINRIHDAVVKRQKYRNQEDFDRAVLEEMEAEVAAEQMQRPESPEPQIDPNLPAHIRLAERQKFHLSHRMRGGKFIDPLELIPNKPVKDEQGLGEVLYALRHGIFTERALAQAMREDMAAAAEIFALVKPFALWVYATSLLDPKWIDAIPEVAKEKIVKLCVIEAHQESTLKHLRATLVNTTGLRNLKCIEFFRKPRLVSVYGKETRKFTHEMAVQYGMRENVRLFFRWAFADDTGVTGTARQGRVNLVTEFIRESRPDGEEGPVLYQDTTHEYTMFSWDTFQQGAMCSPHIHYK